MSTFIRCTLTVFFEEPFWVGVFERQDGRALQSAKITFGALPSNEEVYSMLLEHWQKLHFGPTVNAGVPKETRSPKRRQREASRAVHMTGIGTKSQQALSAARELHKQETSDARRRNRAEESERRYALHQEKRRQKHRGH